MSNVIYINSMRFSKVHCVVKEMYYNGVFKGLKIEVEDGYILKYSENESKIYSSDYVQIPEKDIDETFEKYEVVSEEEISTDIKEESI